MKRSLYFVIPVLFLIACAEKNHVPGSVISQKQMQDVLWDMINAGEYLNSYVLNKDSVDKIARSAETYGEVFEIHHITRDQFVNSYRWYREHPAMMIVLLDSINKKQTIMIEAPGQRPDTLHKKVVGIEEAK